ncbi:uncharacterized protein [Chelonus insularis]|uniref:uncharacterized protein n=1 Tax=Chelonus insularis TaxID=460826 RepID=UPI00158D4E31|nr:uncharacterized protein LOC118070085 [Chelonus insularis]
MVLDNEKLCDSNENFDVIIPSKLLFGLAEDYKQVIVNCKHELILIRADIDLDAIHQTEIANAAAENVKITLDKIEWLVLYVTMSDSKQVDMLSYISKDLSISIPFSSWELYEYPCLPITTKHIWSVKTTNQLEKPRYIIFSLQTGRKNQSSKRADIFDHCKIEDFAVYLNSQRYPYANMNIDILNKNFMERGPFIVIDCSRQNESIKAGPVDVRLEFEATEVFPLGTTAYCLILHDRIVEYKPLSGQIRKLI